MTFGTVRRLKYASLYTKQLISKILFNVIFKNQDEMPKSTSYHTKMLNHFKAKKFFTRLKG